jgi:hypothetical protein
MDTVGRDEFDLYFAGLARDCANTLPDNIEKLLDICRHDAVNHCSIQIAENDSDDDTRAVVKEYQSEHAHVDHSLLDGVDEQFPNRERRIAYLRERLLNDIRAEWTHTANQESTELYVPLDLDSRIVQSIDRNQFLIECNRVASGEIDAVFPISDPYYYDIFALRADGWVEQNCSRAIREKQKKVGTFLAKRDAVYSKMRAKETLTEADRIPVRSAFGGVGIYNTKAISDATYFLDDHPEGVCEHVIFNQSVESKEISTNFVVTAPEEHVAYNQSLVQKVYIALKYTYSDLVRLL